MLTRTVHESHTGENIARQFSNAVEEWGIRDPFAVSDHAANMVNAFTSHLDWPHMGCLGHCLNLIVKKGLRLPNVSKLVSKVRRLFAHFRRSHISAQQLREKQIQLTIPTHKLLIDVETRWNSTLIMLERFLEQEPAVSPVLYISGKQDDRSMVFTENETTVIKKVTIVLKPFDTVTKYVSAEKHPTASIVLPMLKKIGAVLQPVADDPKLIADIKAEMKLDLNSRYQSESVLLFLNISTFLDPRFNDMFVNIDTMESITK